MPTQLRRLAKIQLGTNLLFLIGIWCVLFDLIDIKSNTLNAFLIIVTIYSLSILPGTKNTKIEHRLTYVMQSICYLIILLTLVIILNHMFDWSVNLFDLIYTGMGRLDSANYVMLAFGSSANTVARYALQSKKQDMARMIHVRDDADKHIEEIKADYEKQIQTYKQEIERLEKSSRDK